MYYYIVINAACQGVGVPRADTELLAETGAECRAHIVVRPDAPRPRSTRSPSSAHLQRRYAHPHDASEVALGKIGRASCRERLWRCGGAVACAAAVAQTVV